MQGQPVDRDYYLGGNENTDADREAARLVPHVPLAAFENREFLNHAVRFLAAQSGICQFIDMGHGLPTGGNVHQLAREHNPHARRRPGSDCLRQPSLPC